MYGRIRTKYINVCKVCGEVITCKEQDGSHIICKCGQTDKHIETDLLTEDYLKLYKYVVEKTSKTDPSVDYRLHEYIRQKYVYPHGEFVKELSWIEEEKKSGLVGNKQIDIDWSEFENIINPPVYTPKCPTCGSPNIQKISTTKKALGAFGFGLLSKTAKSQFECLNCGYKW